MHHLNIELIQTDLVIGQINALRQFKTSCETKKTTTKEDRFFINFILYNTLLSFRSNNEHINQEIKNNFIKSFAYYEMNGYDRSNELFYQAAESFINDIQNTLLWEIYAKV